MTNIDDLQLQDYQVLDATNSSILDNIVPIHSKSVSYYPILCAILVSFVVYILTTDWFNNFFKNVQYLGIVKTGIIFGVVMLMILMCF